MYQKTLVLLALFIINSSVFAQEEVMSFTVEGTANMRKKEGFSFSNQKTGDLAMMLVERKRVFASLFDEEFQKKTAFEMEPLPRKYSEIIGYSVRGNVYTIISTNSSQKKYAAQHIDFDSKKSTVYEFKFDFGKEQFLETLHYNNSLYLITATKQNEFILRKLDSKFQFKEIKTFSIQAEAKDQKLLKSGFFTVGIFGGPQVNVTKIDNRVPNAIEQTAQDNKLYQSQNKIYLTLENEDALKTTLHIIDLDSLELTTRVYDYPKGKKSDFKAYNSFILDQNILQLGSSRDEMIILAKDFDGNLVKEHYIDRDQPIPIKNSPIIQEGQTFLPLQQRREMEETSKYLRKVSSGHLGITAYRNGDHYSFTIGGYKNVARAGGGMMMGGVGGPGAVSVPTGNGTVLTYNPTYYSYSGYSSTKSTFFNTSLDNDFNYIEKEEEKNIFERIDDFKEDLKYDTAEDIFFHQDALYYGYFDGKAKIYKLFKM